MRAEPQLSAGFRLEIESAPNVRHMRHGIPTLREVGAVAALGQSLVAHLDGLHDTGHLPHRQREWILRENKWRAGRHGLEAELIVDDDGRLLPAREAIAEVVEMVTPTAEELGCGADLAQVTAMVADGPSYLRQRAAAGGGPKPDLVAVVRSLVRELAEEDDRVATQPELPIPSPPGAQEDASGAEQRATSFEPPARDSAGAPS